MIYEMGTYINLPGDSAVSRDKGLVRYVYNKRWAIVQSRLYHVYYLYDQHESIRCISRTIEGTFKVIGLGDQAETASSHVHSWLSRYLDALYNAQWASPANELALADEHKAEVDRLLDALYK